MLNLNELRKKKGISQEVCANLMGKQTTVYQRWEQGLREPKFNDAMLLAQFFGVSLDYLAGFTDDPSPRWK